MSDHRKRPNVTSGQHTAKLVLPQRTASSAIRPSPCRWIAFVLLHLWRKTRTASVSDLISASSNVGLLIVGIIAVVIYGCQLSTAKTANDLLKTQFEQSQRAWLATGVAVIDKMSFTDGNRLHVSFTLNYTNGGSTPAFGVFLVPTLIFPPGGWSLEQAKLSQAAMCKLGMEEKRKLGIFQSAYPQTPKHFTYELDSPVNDEAKGTPASGSISPLIVGCLYYRFNRSADIHETGFIYMLARRKSNQSITALTYGEDVPLTEVVLDDTWNGEAASLNP